MQPSSIERIAVYVRDGDAVGDGVIKIPFLGTLRRTFPNAQITWIAGKGHSTYGTSLKPLVTGLVAELIDDSQIGNCWSELTQPKPLANHAPFDVLIDTQKSLRTSLLVRRIPHRHYVSSTLNWRLSDYPPLNKTAPTRLIDQLLGLISAVTRKPTALDYQIQLADDYRELAAILLPEGPRYIGFVPGAGKTEKQWPLERFISLAQQQVELGHVAVFFLGPSEQAWHPTIARAVPTALFPERAVPASLQALVGPPLVSCLAARLAAAISNDCGTAHMLAVACSTPIISLFGPTNPNKFPPACQHNVIITAQQFGGDTMACIPLKAVKEAMRQLTTDQEFPARLNYAQNPLLA